MSFLSEHALSDAQISQAAAAAFHVYSLLEGYRTFSLAAFREYCGDAVLAELTKLGCK